MATKETRKDLPSAKKGAMDVTDLHGLREKFRDVSLLDG